MSDIKAGDLVMIVKPDFCCGAGLDEIGKIFTATYVGKHMGQCSECGYCCEEVLVCDDENYDEGFSAYRLIKINPPSIDESITTNQHIPEHA